MVYTCTLNPAIDMFVEVDSLQPNIVNRSSMEDYQANGKAINISIILKRMGIHNTALGFIGGFTGKYIEEELQKIGVDTDFIEVDGITRVNTFISTKDHEYKVVNKGPEIPKKKVDLILQKINEIPTGSILFVSGSTPKGVPDEIHLEISKIAKKNKLKLILDISSRILLDCLAYQPYLIKPNHEELALFFHKDTVTEDEILELGKKLVDMGSENVLISIGGEGSLFLSKDEIIGVTAPKGNVVNTACAGDSLLAAFVGRVLEGDSKEEALKIASATGSSTAFSVGLSDLSDIGELMKQIQIHHY
ncbi:1-phosphofructokinase [Brevibacillus daliensis]|uniref:1-phosphofructokinase n=1 Tax=Brevibacillus daliensis TaxID=2892995 RepID=UPI001E2FA299|nr:1-phosphofructokinase [Brevibacillus daliensis]